MVYKVKVTGLDRNLEKDWENYYVGVVGDSDVPRFALDAEQASSYTKEDAINVRELLRDYFKKHYRYWNISIEIIEA